MNVEKTHTGIFVDDKEVIAVNLSNDKGSSVKIYNYGTIISHFIVLNDKGLPQDIVLGFDDFESYVSSAYKENYPYLGAIIGRYANRIAGAQFELEGTKYDLAKTSGDNCLHGGKKGFDSKMWDIIDTKVTPHASVTFQYLSLDGEEGFPGDLGLQLTFELTNFNELILTYKADTDEATPINLTHHSYFNLIEEGGNVDPHFHQMFASHYLEQDENSAATGNILSVENTHHDFRMGKTIGEGWDEDLGYDQTYVLDKEYGTLTLASKTSDPTGKLSLLVYSTEPVAHFYTAKYLNVKNAKYGRDYNQFDAFCVETQHHPNAVNVPHFPNTILRPGQTYNQTTIYKVVINN